MPTERGFNLGVFNLGIKDAFGFIAKLLLFAGLNLALLACVFIVKALLLAGLKLDLLACCFIVKSLLLAKAPRLTLVLPFPKLSPVLYDLKGSDPPDFGLCK